MRLDTETQTKLGRPMNEYPSLIRLSTFLCQASMKRHRERDFENCYYYSPSKIDCSVADMVSFECLTAGCLSND